MNRLAATLSFIVALFVIAPGAALAQNAICTTMPPGDSSSACASTAFVQAAATLGMPVNTISISRALTAADCGVILAATGNAPITLSPPSTGGLTRCPIVLLNNNTSAGVLLSGFPSTLASNELYPGQSLGLNIVGSAFSVAMVPGRYRPPAGVFNLFVDPTLGLDTNDGLAAGTGRAFKTTQRCLDTFNSDFDLRGWSGVTGEPSSQTQPACSIVSGGNDTAGIHFSPQAIPGANGGAIILITSPGTATISSPTNAAAGFFVNARIQLQNVTLTSTGGGGSGNDLQVGDYAEVYVLSGVTFGAAGTGATHIFVSDTAMVKLPNSYAISGNAAFHYLVAGNASINTSGPITITGSAGLTFTTFALASNQGLLEVPGITFSGFSGISAKRVEADNSAVVIAGVGVTACLNSYFPGNSNGTTFAGGQCDNVQINLATDVTGVLPPANGGVGTGTSGGILGFTPSPTVSAALGANQIVLGGGAGATPTTPVGLGTNITVMHGNAAGAPSFGPVVSSDMNITPTVCTNQFLTGISSIAGGSCATVGASAIGTSAYGFDTCVNLQLNVTVSGNALTVAIVGNNGSAPSTSNPVSCAFHDTTETSGDPVWISATAATSFATGASGSTFGTSNAVASRFWIVAFNNAGTLALGLVNLSGNGTQVFPLNPGVLTSTTACSACTTANVQGTIYTTSALTSKAFRILGYFEATEATAGTWASAPTRIKLFGPDVPRPGVVVQGPLYTSGGTTGSTTSSAFGASVVTLSISPTSAINLVRVTADAAGTTPTAGNILWTVLRRGTSTNVGATNQFGGSAASLISNIRNFALDAPATTASTAYTVYFAASNNTNTVNYPTSSFGNPVWSIQIEEIMGANDNIPGMTALPMVG